jgi:hypothetical protein
LRIKSRATTGGSDDLGTKLHYGHWTACRTLQKEETSLVVADQRISASFQEQMHNSVVAMAHGEIERSFVIRKAIDIHAFGKQDLDDLQVSRCGRIV